MRLLILLAAMLAAHAAFAVEVELSWELPTERENGSPLDPGDLASTTIYAGIEIIAEVPMPATTVTVQLPACTANELTAMVTDTHGLPSDHSETLTILICRPGPPRLSGFRVPPS